MPLYEFSCEKCGHQFEELVSASAKATPRCAKCGSERTRRLMSAACVRTPGSGRTGQFAPPASSCGTGGFS